MLAAASPIAGVHGVTGVCAMYCLYSILAGNLFRGLVIGVLNFKNAE